MRNLFDHFSKAGVDAYVYVGPIEPSGYEQLCELLESKKKRKNALLYLVTGGGDPNAGYRIARALGHHYGVPNFRVAITGSCKSAGTLLCIGAHSLVFFDKGELGPLDIQFQKTDEIFQQSSGLDILRGMTYLRREALETFSEYLLEINGGSGLTTKTASEIASKLVIGMYEPMFAQIDPIRLGEMNAALQIANEYGNRLNDQAKNLKAGALQKLIHSYPTHGFVIDRAEARKLFERVDPPSEEEAKMGEVAGNFAVKKFKVNPGVFDLLDFLDTVFPQEGTNEQGPTEGDSEANGASAGSTPAANEGIAKGTERERPLIEGAEGNDGAASSATSGQVGQP